MNHPITANSFLNRKYSTAPDGKIPGFAASIWLIGRSRVFGRSGSPWLYFQHQQNFSADDLGINLARILGVGRSVRMPHTLPISGLGPLPSSKNRPLVWEAQLCLLRPRVCGCLAQPENLIHTEAKRLSATSGHEQEKQGVGGRGWMF